MNKATVLGLVTATAVAALVVIGGRAPIASADGGPHVVDTSATPDKCAACHRIHTAQTDSLLKAGPTVADLCYTCHGTAGAGSNLSVQNGTYYGTTDRTAPSSSVGLRAGGFDQARINTTDPGYEAIGVLAAAQPTTSWHSNDGTVAGTLWGNGAIGSGAGPSYNLSCTSCHDPHGNGQYRTLRPAPDGSGAAPVIVTDQPNPKVYTTTNYFDVGPVSGVQMSSWCATCHTRYLASSTANSGDPIFAYRHVSNGSTGRTCTKCHAAHGTNAAASGTYSSSVGYPGGGSGTTKSAESRLLKMDNRGICVKCHTGY